MTSKNQFTQEHFDQLIEACLNFKPERKKFKLPEEMEHAELLAENRELNRRINDLMRQIYELQSRPVHVPFYPSRPPTPYPFGPPYNPPSYPCPTYC